MSNVKRCSDDKYSYPHDNAENMAGDRADSDLPDLLMC